MFFVLLLMFSEYNNTINKEKMKSKNEKMKNEERNEEEKRDTDGV